MAIDYFGLSTRDAMEATALIAKARAAEPDWFTDILILYDARPADGPFDKETASDFGIAAKSMFMLSVNDKERFSDVLDDAIEALYRLFGADTLVMTNALERVHPPRETGSS